MSQGVTISGFNEFVTNSKAKLILLDFHAQWCGPCKSLAPILDELVKENHGNVDLLKIDIDHSRELADHFKVRSVPSLFFIKNNKIVDSVVGLFPKRSLELKIQESLHEQKKL